MAKRRVMGKTWWGERWLDALQDCDFDNRLPRGKTYYNQGHLIEMEFNAQKCRIEALVDGSQYYPYEVTLALKPIASDKAEQLIDAIAENPQWVAALLDHRLPIEIAGLCEKLAIELFPKSMRSLSISCTCPDVARLCKHVACVVYALADLIDADPFILFDLRGLPLVERLKERGINLKEAVSDKASTWPELLKECELIESQNQEAFAGDLMSLAIPAMTNMGEALSKFLPRELTTSSIAHFRDRLFQAIHHGQKTLDRLALERYCEQAFIDSVSSFKQFERQNGFTDGRYTLSIDAHCHLQLEVLIPGKRKALRIKQRSRFIQTLFALPAPELEGISEDRLFIRRLLEVAARLYSTYHFMLRVVDVDAKPCLALTPAVRTPEVRRLLSAFASVASPLMDAIVRFDPSFGELNSIEKTYLLASAATEALHADLSDVIDDRNDPFGLFVSAVSLADLNDEVLESITPHLLRYFRNINLADTYPWQPVITARALAQGRVSINFGILKSQKTTKPISLKKLLTDESYQQDRFAALNILSALDDAYPLLKPIREQKGKSLIVQRGELKDFLFEVAPCLSWLGVSVLLPASLRKLLSLKLVAHTTLKVGAKDTHVSLAELADFDLSVSLGGKTLSAEEFESLYRHAGEVIQYEDQFVYLDASELNRIKEKLDDARNLSQLQKTQAVLSGEIDGVEIEKNEILEDRLKELNKVNTIEPPHSLHAELRPYQLRGYSWILKNIRLGLGALVADDMGLGKTLQVIAALTQLKEEGQFETEKGLIVVPATLLANWEREVAKFSPQLRIHRYHGSGRQLGNPSEWDLILTTYGTLKRDLEVIDSLPLNVLVIDEAQAVKNASTEQALALRSIKTKHVIALSGTPVENRLMEYWSIFSLVQPGLLGTAADFQRHFAAPIENDRDPAVIESFRKLTAPFMLRRLKTDRSIISDLPDRDVSDQYCTLLPEQAALYRKTLDESIKRIEKIDTDDAVNAKAVRRAQVLKLITALKQICNSSSQYLKKPSERPDSGKAMMLLELLNRAMSAQRKVLIFTQYREMGETLQVWLKDLLGIEVPFLHGGVPIKKRAQMVDAFQTDASVKVLIVSLKAGGTGLNLTAASVVIHYDLWWNPAVENQATDRAYRIGQTQDVLVYRLITAGTFEEKINQMLEEKKDLADLTVAVGESWIGEMKTEELKALFTLS